MSTETQNWKKLEKARDLLIKKGWATGTLAKDEDGMSVEPESRKAASFCVLGACQRVGADHSPLYAFLPPNNLGISDFNDERGRTLEDVINIFDWAIGAEKAGVKIR